MRGLLHLAAALASVSIVVASPILVRPAPIQQRALISQVTSFLCSRPVLSRLCANIGQRLAPTSGTVIVTTPKGPIIGARTSQATRYTLRYGQALRFADATAVPAWSAPLNATTLPPPCPQNLDPASSSTQEDCLFATFYAPKAATGSSRLPVLIWLHGGSLVYGSSTAPGLDGSVFASRNNAVVVTLQYRLGFLGFLKADSAGAGGNMAVKDVLLALNFVRDTVRSLGGDPNAITLAGQSSGADLVRSLLATPSADLLFQRAVLQSTPANYGDQSPTTASSVGAAFLARVGCSDAACLRGKSVEDILAAQNDVFFSAPASVPGVSATTPIRPFVDGVLVRGNTMPLVNGFDGGLTRRDRSLLFTTVHDEAAPTIDGIAQQVAGGGAIPPDLFVPLTRELLQPALRSDAVLASRLYDPAATATDARDALTALGTEYVCVRPAWQYVLCTYGNRSHRWSCATQQMAINATATKQAARVFLGQFDVGIPYVSTASIAYCAGKVCHEDDIFATFGTGTNLSPAQATLQDEVLARWGAFVRTGSPNAAGLTTWPTVGGTIASPSVLVFDAATGRGRVATTQGVGCDPRRLWGGVVPFDAQLFGP